MEIGISLVLDGVLHRNISTSYQMDYAKSFQSLVMAALLTKQKVWSFTLAMLHLKKLLV